LTIFNNQYKDEKQFEKIFGMFSILGIVKPVGMWGLALSQQYND